MAEVNRADLSRKMQERATQSLQTWWSQSQMDYMRAHQGEDLTGFYAGVVEAHDRTYHNRGREGTCCVVFRQLKTF